MFFFFSKTHTIPHQKPTPPSPPPTTPTRPTCLTTINYKKVFLSAWKTLNERTQTLLDAGSLSLLMNIYDEWKGWAVAVWQPVWMDTLCIAASARAAAVCTVQGGYSGRQRSIIHRGLLGLNSRLWAACCFHWLLFNFTVTGQDQMRPGLTNSHAKNVSKWSKEKKEIQMFIWKEWQRSRFLLTIEELCFEPIQSNGV